MYSYLFGPVPSRRLGISLGIDLVPMKTCSLNCIYCECGRTTELTLMRREYVPTAEVKDELRHYFSHRPLPDIVTFSGSGEPTLHSGIGELIGFIRAQQKTLPIAVLTNGTLLFHQGLRNELKAADLVMPSLDAATDTVFKRINRPHARLELERMIDGLARFRQEFEGRLWLEVFIVPGLNDTDAELSALKRAIDKISPDRIQLNTLDRPGTVASVRAASAEELERILAIWQLDNVSIIAASQARKASQAYREDVESAILETIARRPCTLQDLASILCLHATEVSKYLDVLAGTGKIRSVRQARGVFYMSVTAAPYSANA
jgi:wyosine [tRNA(Phe)-imidazoG37] synthetase (radical SAM superfamily)